MALLNWMKRSAMLRALISGPIRIRRKYLEILGRSGELVLDRLANRAEEDIVIFVPEFEGSFALSPSSDLFRRLLLEGRYETTLVNLFTKYLAPNRDILDIGANVGFYTVLGAKRLSSGRVLAVEPTRAACARLRRNLQHNSVAKKVSVFEGLVSDRAGIQTMNVITGREEYSSVGALAHPSVAGESCVQETATSMTLDELVNTHNLNPGLIKIDVEGAEALVFAAATRTLEIYRPVIISELSNALLCKMGASADMIVSGLEKLGYRVTDPIDPKLRPGTRDFGDILAIPAERFLT